jgi:hypothetical protein
VRHHTGEVERQRRKEELVSAGWREGTALLDEFVAADTAVEVVHRSAHRPFGLSGWRRCGMRDPAAPPLAPEAEIVDAPWPQTARFERPAIDYAALEAAMAHCDEVIRSAKRTLGRLVTSPAPRHVTTPEPSGLAV